MIIAMPGIGTSKESAGSAHLSEYTTCGKLHVNKITPTRSIPGFDFVNATRHLHIPFYNELFHGVLISMINNIENEGPVQ